MLIHRTGCYVTVLGCWLCTSLIFGSGKSLDIVGLENAVQMHSGSTQALIISEVRFVSVDLPPSRQMDGRESHFRNNQVPGRACCSFGVADVFRTIRIVRGRLHDDLRTILGRFENVFKTIQKRFGNDHKRYGSRLKVVRY